MAKIMCLCIGREGREAGDGGGGGASLSNEMEAELACTLYASARPHPAAATMCLDIGFRATKNPVKRDERRITAVSHAR